MSPARSTAKSLRTNGILAAVQCARYDTRLAGSEKWASVKGTTLFLEVGPEVVLCCCELWRWVTQMRRSDNVSQESETCASAEVSHRCAEALAIT